MFSNRYSEAELDQWHTAACTHPSKQDDARTRACNAPMAAQSGQGKPMASHFAAETMPATATESPENWASECLFDCYNS